MVGFRVVQPCADLTGKEKGSANADRADGVELIGVKEDARLNAGRDMSTPVAVAADTVADGLDRRWLVAQFMEDGCGQFSSAQGMADAAPARAFLLAADVVEQRGGYEDTQARCHLSADSNGGCQDPFAMVRAV